MTFLGGGGHLENFSAVVTRFLQNIPWVVSHQSPWRLPFSVLIVGDASCVSLFKFCYRLIYCRFGWLTIGV